MCEYMHTQGYKHETNQVLCKLRQKLCGGGGGNLMISALIQHETDLCISVTQSQAI